MQFSATEKQLKQIVLNAVEWSRVPLRHGPYVTWSPELPFKAENIKLKFYNGWFDVDYVLGRCVKLFIREVENGRYEIENEPTPEYQTWSCKYPTNEALIKSVIDSNSKDFLECSLLE